MSLTSQTVPAGHSSSAASDNLAGAIYDGALALAFAWRPPTTRTDETIALEALSPKAGARLVAPAGDGFPSYLTAAPATVIGFDPRRRVIAAARLRLTALRQLPSHELAMRLLHTGGRGTHAAYDRFVRHAIDAETRRVFGGRTARGVHALSGSGGGALAWSVASRVLGLAGTAGTLRDAATSEGRRRAFEKLAALLFERGLLPFLLRRKIVLEALGFGAVERRALLEAGGGDPMAGLRARLARRIAARPVNEQRSLWRALGGSPARSALPLYLQPQHFAEARDHVDAAVLVCGTVLEALAAQRSESVDGFVLPGALDVLTPPQLNALWFAVTRTAAQGASVVFRTAGQSSSLPGRLDERLLSRWRYDAAAVQGLAPRDGVFRSGALHICRLRD